jgi:hypothetical protein
MDLSLCRRDAEQEFPAQDRRRYGHNVSGSEAQ